jgi:RNA polymerase sigma-70 factor (ECF subfamily)
MQSKPGEPAETSSDRPEPSDGELVAQVREGHRPAFDVLVRRYQKQAVSVSYRLLGNTQDALEVTQDALLKAYRSLDTLERPEAFGGWLMRIVSNLSLNYRRGRALRSRTQLPLDDLLGTQADAQAGAVSSSSADPVRSLEGVELGVRLKQALAALPEKQRRAIMMFTVDQMPQKDVAEALDLSVEAVKWHVFQGRKKLREMLEDVL